GGAGRRARARCRPAEAPGARDRVVVARLAEALLAARRAARSERRRARLARPPRRLPFARDARHDDPVERRAAAGARAALLGLLAAAPRAAVGPRILARAARGD